MEEEIKDEIVAPADETPDQVEVKSFVETIVQNGVSKEELREMLADILKPVVTEDAVAAAQEEFFNSFIKEG